MRSNIGPDTPHLDAACKARKSSPWILRGQAQAEAAKDVAGARADERRRGHGEG
jgi:hypothetical protein